MENAEANGAEAPAGTERERIPLTVPAAALALGIKERAVRKRIATGSLEAVRDGGRWLVYLPEPPVNGAAPTQSTRQERSIPRRSTQTSVARRERPASTPERDPLAALLEELRELRRRNEELAANAGFWQGRYQEAQETIKLLQAPPSEDEVADEAAEDDAAGRPWWHFW